MCVNIYIILSNYHNYATISKVTNFNFITNVRKSWNMRQYIMNFSIDNIRLHVTWIHIYYSCASNYQSLIPEWVRTQIGYWKDPGHRHRSVPSITAIRAVRSFARLDARKIIQLRNGQYPRTYLSLSSRTHYPTLWVSHLSPLKFKESRETCLKIIQSRRKAHSSERENSLNLKTNRYSSDASALWC